ncbi:MAG: hypothetical protein HN366_04935 [Deltaproteobacteria bacterium]|nr:hypothetical protein [Deltaproteobacteria bacterium]
MKELDESNNLLARIEDILSKAELIFTRNFEKEKDTIALKALSESRGALELMARIAAHLHQARAAELENTKTTFSVVVGADDEETSIFDRAADMLSSAEFAELIRLTDKIQNGNDQSISPGTEEYAYHEDPDPYPGIPQDLTVDPRPLKSTPDMDETPLSTDPEPEPEPLSESKMVRTKKPMAQIPKPIEPTQIDGPRTISAAIISRKKSGIAYLK